MADYCSKSGCQYSFADIKPALDGRTYVPGIKHEQL